mmetsp:Transcript_872/g.1905  ORF Transcript_872/g.1905 Transcript_872/m.1905 type:complete len:382 (-) Transcript_872:150-1295(-)
MVLGAPTRDGLPYQDGQDGDGWCKVRTIHRAAARRESRLAAAGDALTERGRPRPPLHQPRCHPPATRAAGRVPLGIRRRRGRAEQRIRPRQLRPTLAAILARALGCARPAAAWGRSTGASAPARRAAGASQKGRPPPERREFVKSRDRFRGGAVSASSESPPPKGPGTKGPTQAAADGPALRPAQWEHPTTGRAGPRTQRGRHACGQRGRHLTAAAVTTPGAAAAAAAADAAAATAAAAANAVPAATSVRRAAGVAACGRHRQCATPAARAGAQQCVRAATQQSPPGAEGGWRASEQPTTQGPPPGGTLSAASSAAPAAGAADPIPAAADCTPGAAAPGTPGTAAGAGAGAGTTATSTGIQIGGAPRVAPSGRLFTIRLWS